MSDASGVEPVWRLVGEREIVAWGRGQEGGTDACQL